MTEPIQTDGALIEDLTRRAEAATPPESYVLDHSSHIIARVERTDESLVTTNLERWLAVPTRARGGAALHDPGDFVTYVRRLGTTRSTVWGNLDRATFTAVFNDHGDDVTPGWRDHTATLQLQDDPDWLAFLKYDGHLLTQVQFAEFLQDYQAVFVEPDGATLLEIATSFKARRKAEYSSAIDLDNGDLQLTYSETTTAQGATKSGQIEVPKAVVVELTPYLGMPPVKLGARLKWNLDDGAIQLGFKLQRADLVKRAAFDRVSELIVDGMNDVGIAVLHGVAPNAVVPQV